MVGLSHEPSTLPRYPEGLVWALFGRTYDGRAYESWAWNYVTVLGQYSGVRLSQKRSHIQLRALIRKEVVISSMRLKKPVAQTAKGLYRIGALFQYDLQE